MVTTVQWHVVSMRESLKIGFARVGGGEEDLVAKKLASLVIRNRGTLSIFFFAYSIKIQ
jgi:hypothetical protein